MNANAVLVQDDGTDAWMHTIKNAVPIHDDCMYRRLVGWRASDICTQEHAGPQEHGPDRVLKHKGAVQVYGTETRGALTCSMKL